MTLLAAEAGGMPAFLPQAAALVVSAAAIGYLFVRLRIVPIIGFLLAGTLIGPSMLGLVTEREAIDAVAEVGVVLLPQLGGAGGSAWELVRALGTAAAVIAVVLVVARRVMPQLLEAVARACSPRCSC